MTTAVPADEAAVQGVDLPALHAYLDRVVPGPERRVTLLKGGRSNLTYLLQGGDRDLVLRRPPLGELLPTAHDMAREHRVQEALWTAGYPVPRPVAFCRDRAVTGTDCYVMEFVDGLILDDVGDLPPLGPDDARALSHRLVDALAQLHAVDPVRAGLADLGRPDGYLERQVGRWVAQWSASRTRPLPELDELARRLRRARPRSPDRAAVLHGDFRLGNMVLAPTPGFPVRAVLDWELSTLGDPLADLGFTLAFWREDGGPVLAGDPSYVVPTPGFLPKTEMVERYAAASGLDVSDIDYYVVLACFKTAVIFEGIHARHLARSTVGEGFDGSGERVVELVEQAFDVAARSDVRHLRG